MIKKIIAILSICLLMTGCFNYNELNQLAIITAMAVDKEDDNYVVSILIANSKNNQSTSKEGESQTVVYSAKGKTISEALKNIDLENPRQNYVGHLSALIVSEEVARDGLLNVLDLLFRNSESTKRFYMAVAKDQKAKDILKIVSPLESFPSQTISTNIQTSSESQAVSIAVVYSEFIDLMIKKGVEPVLPTITIEGNVKSGSKNSNLEQSEPKAKLKLSTVALFKDDKLIGFADKNQSRGINLALGKITDMIIQYKCEENYLVSEIHNVTSKIDVDIKDDIKATINIKATGDIIENTCDIDLTNPKKIKKIKEDVDRKIKKLVEEGIDYAQSNKLDILGIGNIVYKKSPKLFNEIDNWNDYFSNIDFDIKIDANIITKGSTKQSLKEALNGN